MTVPFEFTPRYPIQPSIQDYRTDGEVITGWIIRAAMRHQGVYHEVEHSYDCETDERVPLGSALRDSILERICMKVFASENLLERCADELEAKIAAQINGDPNG